MGRDELIYDQHFSGVSRVSKIFEQNQDVCVIGQVFIIILLFFIHLPSVYSVDGMANC